MTTEADGAPSSDLAEVDAMKKVVEALSGLEPSRRERVLWWASRVFRTESEARKEAAGPREAAIEKPLTEATDVAELLAIAEPVTNAEKALVVGYWFQEREGLEDMDSFTINSTLKQLGHGVQNITLAMAALTNRKPQFVVQTKKSGSSRQARKRYRLTQEGIREVQRMLRTGSMK